MASDNGLTMTGNVFSVLTQNPGVTFTAAQLKLVQRNQIIIKQGCVDRLVYNRSSDELTYVELDQTGGISPVNVNDFRSIFERAVDHGHRLLFCYNEETREMVMPHVFPCRCTCDKRD